MTFRSLALNNIRGNWRAYAAFFLSSVFSVLIFYLYASFINHPDVINGYIRSAAEVRPMMRNCMYVIIVFSFFFALYSNSSFIKTRKKEFGLLSLFGTTRFQLRKMVVYESLAITLSSIVAGIGLGMLFSKLFFMALGALLQSSLPLRFTVPLPALLLTLNSFAILFVIIALLTALMVGRTEIIDLLTDSRKPKKSPATSPLFAALAILTLGTGYGMLTMVTKENIAILALSILGLVVLGTYFFYTQLSIAIIKLLQHSKRFYYRGTNLLTVSQMAFRIKDNSRVLFVVTLLTAIVISAVSTVCVLQKEKHDDIMDGHPFMIGYIEGGEGHSVLAPQEAVKRLQEGGAEISEQFEVSGLKADDLIDKTDEWNKKNPVMIISLSDYNKLALRLKLPERQLNSGTVAGGECFRVYSRKAKINREKQNSISGSIGGKPFELVPAEPALGNVINRIAESDRGVLVVSDRQLAQWKETSPAAAAVVRFYGFELREYQHQLVAIQSFKNGLTDEQLQRTETNRMETSQSEKMRNALTLFIGLFISALFFIASGGLLYFKLFTELREDCNLFRSLHRIGFTASELRRTVGTQVAVLFLLPCLIGIVHSFFATLTLGALVKQPAWMYGLVIMGIYILMQAVYSFISYAMYTRSVTRSVAS